MRSELAQALRALNAEFYAWHANAFSSTRQYPWAGWAELCTDLPSGRYLDLGCGNGRFLEALKAAGRAPQTFVGVDQDATLLKKARARTLEGGQLEWVEDDLLAETKASWRTASFDVVTLFGVLHHVYGEEARAALFRNLAGRLSSGGRAVVTSWTFADDARFPKLKIDWEEFFAARAWPEAWRADLGPDDHLLSFQGDRTHPRYAYALGEAEEVALAKQANLEVERRFYADGKSGRLNRYAVLRQIEAP